MSNNRVCVGGGAVAWWLTPQTPDPEVGGFEPQSGRRSVSLSKTYLPPKVLVIPRKRWLPPNMTEKLFTGTLSIKPNNNRVANFTSLVRTMDL